MYPIMLDDYLNRVQEIFRNGAFQELLPFIEQARRSAEEDSFFAAFLSGEIAFYNAQYEKALEHYLKAQGVEHFQFYCYRASAHMFHSKGNVDKALKFIQKAVEIYPNDHSSQLLLHTLTRDLTLPPESKTEKVEPSPPFSQEEDSSAADTSKDKFMNTDTSLCPYSSTRSPGARALLIQRLYPFEERTDYLDSSSISNKDCYINALNSLNQNESTQGSKFAPVGTLLKTIDSELELECAMHKFSEFQSKYLSNYLQKFEERAPQPDHCLVAFHGWGKEADDVNDPPKTSPDAMLFLLAEQFRKASGGFFIRWNNKGIVINPGRSFLNRFYDAGWRIGDIDYVIVTQEEFEKYSDIKGIYELNSLLASQRQGMRLIHYYLNPTAYKELTTILKPQSKQERQAIHSLELFIDSPEVETVNLDLGIDLHYFPISQHPLVSQDFIHKPERHATSSPMLGFQLELTSGGDSFCAQLSSVNVGYISGAGWFPFAAKHFASSDVLIAGFGNTGVNDYNRIAHLDDCLGYFGINSLLEEVNPKLLLCTEFGGREGDIRLEIVRKLRADLHQFKWDLQSHTTIVPADNGLFLDLKDLKIKCSTTDVMVDFGEIGIVRSGGPFGKLRYLSRSCLL